MGFIDGPKRNGRYLKKESAVLKGVQLAKFSFGEICELNVQALDNPEASIIHVKYHDPLDLAESVRPPAMLTNNLIGERRNILFPRDFTNDWARERDRQKRRTVRLGEDDDEIDLEEEAAQAAEAQKRAASRASKNANVGVAAKQTDQTSVPDGNPIPTPEAVDDAAAATAEVPPTNVSPSGFVEPLPTPEQENLRQFTEQKKTIDQVSRVLKDLNTAESNAPLSEESLTIERASAEGDNFQPLNPGSSGPENLSSREIELAPKSMRTPMISEQELQALRDEAKQAGYSDGFKIGEEKASLQTRQMAGQLFTHVQDLLQNLMGLKDQILSNVQENFVEVLQAMAEALIKREFSVNPEALQTVIRKAVKEVIGQNEVKISVHPTTFDALNTLSSEDFIKSLAKDETIQPGDFRIDSTLTTVDGNATELIRTMLNKLDLDLFQTKTDDSKKAS